MNNISFNSKLSSEKISYLSKLPKLLENIDNKIPLAMKKPFNFKGRKSVEIAKIIINYLSDENSLICDPFMGSGSFILSSCLLNRNTIGIELDNYTYDIVNLLFADVNISKIENIYSEIKENVFNQIMDLYKTECCGHENYIKTLFFDPYTKEYYNPKKHRDIKKNNHNIKLYYQCPVCGNKTKQFSSIDENKLVGINNFDVSKFPSHELIENSRINITASTGANKYDCIFTKRTKLALLIIQNAISNLDDSPEKLFFQHVLVSSLTLSRLAQYGSSSDILYHIIKNKAQEMNVWYVFQEKYESIVKYIVNFTSKIKSSPSLFNDSYQNVLSKKTFNNYFDIIYTDPPYTDQVPYLERNQLYRDWLQRFYDRKKFKLTSSMLNSEMVVTNAPSRPEKNMENYLNDIDEMFSLFSKSVKEEGYVVLTLNLGKKRFLEIFSTFINYARKNGFEYVYRLDLTKNDPSLRKQSAWKNTLSKEMLVIFTKLKRDDAYWYIDNKNVEIEIGKIIYNHIVKNGKITQTAAINMICKEILNINISNISATEKKKIFILLKNEFLLDKETSCYSINPDKLYISIEDNSSLFSKLYDIVPVIIKKLLLKYGKFTLDDLYFEISFNLCNGDPSTLAKVFEDSNHENYIKLLLKNYCDINNKNYYIEKKLNNEINENAIDISSVDGYDFEKILEKLLIAEGYSDVIRIGGAGDRGVDLMAKKININTKQMEGYIFQAKRWIGNVGGEPIQRLHSMMIQNSQNIQHAICITTSDYTQQGLIESKNTGVQTINGSDLIERLNNSFPGCYYHGLLNFNNDIK